jgi:peptidoglycan/LPS O-acetylase OafA/YrhL
LSIGARNSRIDLMRGVSIMLVLLHHFNIAYRMNDTVLAKIFGWTALHAVFRNGNYAVTMFFVISGFLITSNAHRRWNGLSNLKALTFYRFRAARIIPSLLLLLLIVNLLAALKIPIFENHPEFGGPVSFWVVNLASLTFWMNVLMSHSGWLNYVLCVQWSLSVEEVFYLAFPVLCCLLRRERHLLIVWGIFIVLGPIWRATHQASEYDELNSYLSCFDGIAFGCCAAVLAKYIRLPSWSTASIQGVVAVGMAWFYLSASIGDTAVYGVTLIAFGTAILLIVQSAGINLHAKPTAPFAPLRGCGRLSYELYLFHLIVLGALRTIWLPQETTGNSKLLLLASFLLLSTILAHLVSRYYSEPMNERFRSWASASPKLAEA